MEIERVFLSLSFAFLVVFRLGFFFLMDQDVGNGVDDLDVVVVVVRRRRSRRSRRGTGTGLPLDVPAQLPLESDRLELSDAAVGHVGRPAPEVELVLPALALDPRRQLRVVLEVGRDVAVPVLPSEVVQFVEPFLPRGPLRIPNKVEIFQSLDAFGRHGRRLALLHELVLVPLPLHPTGQRQIFRVRVRNAAVSLAFAVRLEFYVLFRPLSRLIGTEPTRPLPLTGHLLLLPALELGRRQLGLAVAARRRGLGGAGGRGGGLGRRRGDGDWDGRVGSRHGHQQLRRRGGFVEVVVVVVVVFVVVE